MHQAKMRMQNPSRQTVYARMSRKTLLCLTWANCIFAGDIRSYAVDQGETNRLAVIALQVHTELTNAIKAGTEDLMQLLTRPIPKSMEVPLPSETKQVYDGHSLPSFFFNPGLPSRDYDDILKGKRFGATEDEFRVSQRWIHAIPALVKKDAAELVDWLTARSSNLPPNSADLLVAVALGSSEWDRRSEHFWEETRENWRRMLKARNPVYRLTALGNLSRFETNSLRMIEVCDAALHETNSIFQFCALEVLPQVRGPASAKTIEDFINRAPHTNDGTLPSDFDIRDLAREALVKSRSGP